MKQTVTISWAWIGAYALLTAILGLNIYNLTTNTEQRSITVEGTATIKAEPDSFAFYPQFEIAEADQAKAKAALTAKGNEVVGKLKDLGLKDRDIKLDASQYDNYPKPVMGTPEIDRAQNTVLSMTITVENKAMAQKVQDYLNSTNAKGQLTPQPAFSEAKREALTREAEAKAIEDARRKGDAMAKNLGAKRGKVITINNPQNASVPLPAIARDSASSSSSLPIQPGTNDFAYHISIKFALH
jgi:uncharacterized protein